MLKKEITYENFDGETVTETLYFHISKTDLFELEVEHEEGLEEWLKHITESNNRKELFNEFKKLLLLSYGERSEDGKRFIKSPELSQEFSQTGAYEALFMELVTDEKVALEFIAATLPKDIAQSARQNMELSLETQTTQDVATLEPEKKVDDVGPKDEAVVAGPTDS